LAKSHNPVGGTVEHHHRFSGRAPPPPAGFFSPPASEASFAEISEADKSAFLTAPHEVHFYQKMPREQF
jgi:hypothetical protein